MSIRVVIGIALLTFSPGALANQDDCRSAIDQFNSVASDISASLKRYARCLSGSQGLYDCSYEFRHLKSGQDDLESAVSNYGLECR